MAMQETSDAQQEFGVVGAPRGGSTAAGSARAARASSSRRSRLFRRSWPVLVVMAIAAGFSVAYLGGGLWAAGGETWRGNTGDPEQFMWFLAWMPHAIPQAILHGHDPLVSTYQLFPRGTNLMWNTSVVFPAVLVSPITALAGPVFTYNLLIVLGPIASSGTAYWAFRRYVDSRLAAGIGALAFAFCPFVMGHTSGHLHLILLALVPVTVVLVDELLVRQRRRSWLIGGLLGVVAACQLLTSEEVLAIEVIAGVVAVIVLCLLHPHAVRSRIGYVVGGGVCAAVAFVVLAGYPLYVQLRGPQRAPGAHQPGTYSTDLFNLVWPVNQQFDFGVGKPSFTGNASEWTGYIGIPLIVLLVVVAIRTWRRRPVVPVAAILVVVLAVLSLGPHLHLNGHKSIPLPWAGFARLPLLGNLLPGRVSLAIALFAALLIAVFVDELVRARHLWWKIAGAALVVVVALSLVPGGLRTTTVVTPPFFTTAAQNRIPDGSVALVVPYIKGPGNEHPSLWQANGGMRYRMMDGWVIVPGLHWGGPNVISEAIDHAATISVTPPVRDSILDELHARQVHTVVVGPTDDRPAVISLFSRVLGAPPTSVGGVDLWSVPVR
jgi:hypothetical protein